MAYEVLDSIADFYNPMLFLGYIIFSVLYWQAGDRLAVLRGFCGGVVAYIFMFVNKNWQFWASVELDYSTHSAVALALIVFHIHKRSIKSRPAILLSMSLVIYYILVVYQQYHSAMDVVTTILALGPFMLLIYKVIGIRKSIEGRVTSH
jgi:hypothetical protein